MISETLLNGLIVFGAYTISFILTIALLIIMINVGFIIILCIIKLCRLLGAEKPENLPEAIVNIFFAPAKWAIKKIMED